MILLICVNIELVVKVTENLDLNSQTLNDENKHLR